MIQLPVQDCDMQVWQWSGASSATKHLPQDGLWLAPQVRWFIYQVETHVSVCAFFCVRFHVRKKKKNSDSGVFVPWTNQRDNRQGTLSPRVHLKKGWMRRRICVADLMVPQIQWPISSVVSHPSITFQSDPSLGEKQYKQSGNNYAAIAAVIYLNARGMYLKCNILMSRVFYWWALIAAWTHDSIAAFWTHLAPLGSNYPLIQAICKELCLQATDLVRTNGCNIYDNPFFLERCWSTCSD